MDNYFRFWDKNHKCMEIHLPVQSYDFTGTKFHFEIGWLYKFNRTFIAFLVNVCQDCVLEDLTNSCQYIVTSKQINDSSTLKYCYTFGLTPITEQAYQNVIYNINATGCNFSFDNSITNINNQLSLLPLEDQESAKELFEYIIQSEHVEKSKLEKFKDMLLRNTDVLGLLSQILLAIISKPV